MNTNIEEDTRYFEGCGHEGPIRCIFLCEFHPVAGPKITCQVGINSLDLRCRYVWVFTVSLGSRFSGTKKMFCGPGRFLNKEMVSSSKNMTTNKRIMSADEAIKCVTGYSEVFILFGNSTKKVCAKGGHKRFLKHRYCS